MAEAINDLIVAAETTAKEAVELAAAKDPTMDKDTEAEIFNETFHCCMDAVADTANQRVLSKSYKAEVDRKYHKIKKWLEKAVKCQCGMPAQPNGECRYCQKEREDVKAYSNPTDAA